MKELRILCIKAAQYIPLKTRPSISRLAKSKGAEKKRVIALSEFGEIYRISLHPGPYLELGRRGIAAFWNGVH
jgi:hypothetical protein